MEHLVDKIAARFEMEMPEEPPSLTIVIPTYNSFERMGITLESIKRQEYPKLEVIIVDAGSTDQTLKVAAQYASMISRIYTTSRFHLPEMFNRGIALATSRYFSILYPGSFYLSKYALQTFAKHAVQTNSPELVYAGTIQRELRREPLQYQEHLSEHLLKIGRVPCPLVSCWFRSDLFDLIGKVETRYTYRYGFDLLCRIEAMKERRVEHIGRILLDYDYGVFTYRKALAHAKETWAILKKHFGVKRALLWFFTLDHIQLTRFVFSYLKSQIFK